MTAYMSAASRVSPSYSNAVREKVEKKLKDTSKEKQFKYKNTKEVLEAYAQYEEKPTDSSDEKDRKKKMREDILKKVEQTQPLLAAELTKVKGLYLNPNGTEKTAAQVIEGNFRSLQNKEILELLEKSRSGDITMTKAMDELLAGRVKKLEDYKNLLNSATPEQQMDIAHIAAKNIDEQRSAKAQRERRVVKNKKQHERVL